jgi:hypothetical protein
MGSEAQGKGLFSEVHNVTVAWWLELQGTSSQPMKVLVVNLTLMRLFFVLRTKRLEQCNLSYMQITDAAKTLVDTLHKSKEFTDTANFALRCGVCNKGLKGEKEAVEHAKQTSHQNFQEY